MKLLVLALALCAACGAAATSGSTGVVHRVRQLPPDDKAVVEALFASGTVELTDSTCAGAGTRVDDRTVGAYLSGFLVELNDPEARNYIEVKREHVERGWVVSVMLRHAKDEDIWGWGVEFVIRAHDGSVDTQTFRCLGAG